MKATLKNGDRLNIAASCFSIYAYEALRETLEGVKEVRFLFTEPTFTAATSAKTQREFYIPKLNRERSLCGSEFEVKLRNELKQKAVARECADWIRRKASFKSNKTNEVIQGFAATEDVSYTPILGFTTVDLGIEKGNRVNTAINGPFFPRCLRWWRKSDILRTKGTVLRQGCLPSICVLRCFLC